VQTTIQPIDVVVVGAGLMGTGIAHAFVTTGSTVALVDVRPDALDKARATIRGILDEGVRRGKGTAGESDAAMARLSTGPDLSAALDGQPVQLLVETAVEAIAAKTAIARQADALMPKDALIATNTSALSVTEIAAATRRPAQVVGMHFFNPVHKMKLVEIVRGLATSPEAIRTARAWVERLGKQSILVQESPGLTTSRMSALAGNEAMYMLMEGVASAEDIDAAMRGAFNHPMGPLELGDLTGWDTRLAVLQYLHQTLGEKYRPCPLIIKLVKSGRFGRKTGHGVYRYVDGQKVPGSGLGAVDA
jgi:3-hydroxybutyryl-CoA dehydrogenase